MYKISSVISNGKVKRSCKERIVQELNKFGAKRVFLGLGQYETDENKRETTMLELAENCKFLRENGFEVGAWGWTFWPKKNIGFRNMRGIDGNEIKEFMCPTDEKFVEFVVDYIKDIAKCGVEIIQFDDDFRYGFLAGCTACLCDGHITEINKITGENSTREELEKYITSGEKNKFRDAYLKVNGDSFKKFAKAARNAVNEINPQIRISFCTCMSSWDVDGTDAYELAKILAGDTKPLVRLIGAPYWAVNKSWGNCLQDVVELHRMESAWTRNGEIEIMAEGDVWPRPRTCCPASYLEGFDTAIRASGCTDGIIKYGIDLSSNIEYETEYAKFHERNLEIYDKIDSFFCNKAHCGVRVYESMKKIADMVMPTKVNDTVNIDDLFFSKAARTLAYNTIPTVYEGAGVCGIAFDENARNLPVEALKNGLIIDIAAAEILMERGIDVGINEIGEKTKGLEERFIIDNNHILTQGATFYNLKLNKTAEILSDSETENGIVPVSYRYQNADGYKFLVLNINTRTPNDNILKHYARSRQYAEQIQWLSGQKLPAYVYGNPALYIQCKEEGNTMAVGLWNYCADIAIEPVVELSREYSQIEFINCNGTLKGDKVYLTDIPAFGFVGFEIK